MPQYQFYVGDEPLLSSGSTIELSDQERALRVAERLTGDLLRDGSASIWGEQFSVTITTDSGLLVGMIDVIGTISPAFKR